MGHPWNRPYSPQAILDFQIEGKSHRERERKRERERILLDLRQWSSLDFPRSFISTLSAYQHDPVLSSRRPGDPVVLHR